MCKDKKMKNLKLNIAIRADGNSRIGLGHIIRTMALGNEFKKNNCNVVYITKDNKDTLDILKKNEFDYFIVESNNSLKEEIDIVNEMMQDCDIFIGDSFAINKKYIASIKKNKKFIVIIDNLRDMSVKADLIINGGIYAYSLAKNAVKFNQRILLGTEYLLIREQFTNSKKRDINKTVKNILVTMGGSDPLKQTPNIISVLGELEKNLKINVVIGNGFTNIEEIEKISKKNHRIVLHYNVENMANLMFQNDIAITAGGTTLYELAITGTPAIVLIQAENQVLPSTIFHDKGTIINLGYSDKVSELYFKEILIKLINDYDKRKEMSTIGQRILDGRGATRCVEEIFNIYNELI